MNATATYADLVGPLLDEELVLLQRCSPGGRWGHPVLQLLIRLSGRGRLDRRLPQETLLVVTATQVSVRGVEHGYHHPGGLRILDPLGTWPRAAVSGTVRPVTMSSLTSSALDTPSSSTSVDVLRATLHTPDGILSLDLPDHSRPSRQMIALVHLEREPGPWRRLADRLRGRAR